MRTAGSRIESVSRHGDGDSGLPRNLAARSASAVQRRAAYAWRMLSVGDRPPGVPAAMEWLTQRSAHGKQGAPCPGATGAALATLVEYGQLDRASAWADWLLSIQLADGAFPDAGLRHASLFNTGQALSGLLALCDHTTTLRGPAASGLPPWHLAAERAADYLAAHVNGQGQVLPSDRGGASFDLWAPPAFHLACLPPLLTAAQRFNAPAWESAVWRAVAGARRTVDLASWAGPGRVFAHAIDAVVDLASRDARLCDWALAAMRLPAARQRPDGCMPTEQSRRGTSSAALAHLAVIWYKLAEQDLGARRRADAILASLRRRQLASGGFAAWLDNGVVRLLPRPQLRRRATNAGPSPNACGPLSGAMADSWPVIHFLEASRRQVRVAFEAGPSELPTEIDASDGRLLAVRCWFASLVGSPAVADVGCGPGRFLRHLANWRPEARLTGIDDSQRWLSKLPPGVQRLAGSLLNIPAGNACFDGAMAVESLEHALLPDRAVDELCRIVRPGGRVLVIDKHRAKQALSVHAPWEQWFEPDEVAAWLARHCRDVSIAEVSHGRLSRPSGLFLCWQATRR